MVSSFKKIIMASLTAFGAILPNEKLMAKSEIPLEGIFNVCSKGTIEEPDLSMQKAGWEWQLKSYRPGTRYQGVHGVLLKKEKLVQGKPGQVIETPWGEMKYYRHFKDRDFAMGISGWNMQDLKKLKCPELKAKP